MGTTVPFRGLIYNQDKIDNPADVVAPPYDVISNEMQNILYHRHPDNVVRLILGKKYPDDSKDNNRYSRAAMDFKRWRSEGVLIQDREPSIYFYSQTYSLENGLKKTRKGIIARSLIEEFGKGSIHPHEKTLSGPKNDRLKLTEACKANFSCIFALYSQPDMEINKTLDKRIVELPMMDFIDDEGISNSVWRIRDKELIKYVSAELSRKSIFIADGHHRYETALNYRNLVRERRKTWTGNEPENYVMIYFSNMDDDGMTILPTHRVVHGLPCFDPAKFLEACREFFEIDNHVSCTDGSQQNDIDQLLSKLGAEAVSHSFGIYIKEKKRFFIMRLKEDALVKDLLREIIAPDFMDLDVSLLHSLILNRILGIDNEAQEDQKNIIYVKDSKKIVNVTEERGQVAFILNPTPIEQIKNICKSGHVMPQKSTYFYPKLISGIVMNPFEDVTPEE